MYVQAVSRINAAMAPFLSVNAATLCARWNQEAQVMSRVSGMKMIELVMSHVAKPGVSVQRSLRFEKV